MNSLYIPLVAGLVAAVTSRLVLPSAHRWFRRQGWVDDPGERKIHQAPTPLAGGFALLVGVLAGLATGVSVERVAWGNGPSAVGWDLLDWTYLALAVGLFFLGWWDDVAELSPKSKLGGQLLLAVIVLVSGERLPVASEWPVMQWTLTGLFFLATLNAINFLDNMNGLCGGLGCIAAVQLGLMAVRLEQPALGVQAWVLAGACLGFLPTNFPRASTFLGDAGSHLIGGLLAVIVLRTLAAGDGHMGHVLWPPLWVLAVPAVDLVQVVIGRIWRRRPIYVGDTWHVSHLLTRAGCSRTTAVVLLWAVAVLAGAVGVLALFR